MKLAIKVERPIIEFNDYEVSLERARQVADYINSIELTDDNEKDVKKELAEARKLVKALEDRRKEVKNWIMEPYELFAERVKDITSVIDEADNNLRQQVRAKEDRERELKTDKLEYIWDLRAKQYKFPKYIKDGFVVWLENKHLNKTYSLHKCETDMTEWMESTEADIDTILQMSDPEEIMLEYVGRLNLADAIRSVRANREIKERIEQADTNRPETATFIVEGESNIKFTKVLLEGNGIKFTMK